MLLVGAEPELHVGGLFLPQAHTLGQRRQPSARHPSQPPEVELDLLGAARGRRRPYRVLQQLTALAIQGPACRDDDDPALHANFKASMLGRLVVGRHLRARVRL